MCVPFLCLQSLLHLLVLAELKGQFLLSSKMDVYKNAHACSQGHERWGRGQKSGDAAVWPVTWSMDHLPFVGYSFKSQYFRWYHSVGSWGTELWGRALLSTNALLNEWGTLHFKQKAVWGADEVLKSVCRWYRHSHAKDPDVLDPWKWQSLPQVKIRGMATPSCGLSRSDYRWLTESLSTTAASCGMIAAWDYAHPETSYQD